MVTISLFLRLIQWKTQLGLQHPEAAQLHEKRCFEKQGCGNPSACLSVQMVTWIAGKLLRHLQKRFSFNIFPTQQCKTQLFKQFQMCFCLPTTEFLRSENLSQQIGDLRWGELLLHCSFECMFGGSKMAKGVWWSSVCLSKVQLYIKCSSISEPKPWIHTTNGACTSFIVAAVYRGRTWH